MQETNTSIRSGSAILPGQRGENAGRRRCRRGCGFGAALLALVLLIASAGCGERSSQTTTDAAGTPAGAIGADFDSSERVLREFVDPATGVTAVMTAGPRSISTIEPLQMRIVLERPPDYRLASSMSDLVASGLPDGWEVDAATRVVTELDAAGNTLPRDDDASARPVRGSGGGTGSNSGSAAPRVPAPHKVREVHDLTISPFVPGMIEVGPLILSLRPEPSEGQDKAPTTPGRQTSQGPVAAGQGDGSIEVRLDAFPIEVVSALAEVESGTASDPLAGAAGGPADLRDPVDAPPTPIPAWFWWAIAGGVLAVASALAGIVWLAVRASRREPKPIVRQRTADEIAYSALNRLVASRLIEEPGGPERLVDRASNILRQYVEDRFGLRAPELTTDEFLAEARHSSYFEAGDLILFERFLRTTDLVKFAAAGAERGQAEEAAALVRAFVDRTRLAAGGQQVVIRFDADGRRIGRVAPPHDEVPQPISAALADRARSEAASRRTGKAPTSVVVSTASQAPTNVQTATGDPAEQPAPRAPGIEQEGRRDVSL